MDLEPHRSELTAFCYRIADRDVLRAFELPEKISAGEMLRSR